MKLVLGLSPGKIAFYDPLSSMHFHLGNPVQAVPEGVDTTKLHQAVKYKTLSILEGTFDIEDDKPKEDKTKEAKPPAKQEKKVEKTPPKEPQKKTTEDDIPEKSSKKPAEEKPSSDKSTKTKDPKSDKSSNKNTKAESKKGSDKDVKDE